jgi:hypothetical protein
MGRSAAGRSAASQVAQARADNHGVTRFRRWQLPAQALVTLLVLVAGLEAARHLRSTSSLLPGGTAAQRASVNQLVSSLPAPPGATRDPYATACGVPTTYCVSSPTASRETLLRDVARLLASRGAKHVDGGCITDPQVSLCSQSFVLHGVGVALGARDTGGPRFRVPAHVWVGVVGAQERPAEPAPLGTWAALGLQAPAWRGAVSCTVKEPHGCGRYEGRLVAAGHMPAVAEQARSLFTRRGYLVEAVDCDARRCFVFGTRFRALDGGQAVNASVLVKEGRPGLSTLTVKVSDGWIRY